MEEKKRPRRKFTDEFKSRAVDLMLKQGLSVSQAARDLGIYESNLGSWVKRDNVVVESFFGTLKKELVYRRSWPTRSEAASAIHEYIEVFYNRVRRHSTLGGKSPAAFEAIYLHNLTQAA